MTENKEVIFIDDEKYIRIAARQVLERAGYHPLCFNSAEKAISRLTLEWPGVSVNDVLIPRIDGFSFMKSLRRSPYSNGT